MFCVQYKKFAVDCSSISFQIVVRISLSLLSESALVSGGDDGYSECSVAITHGSRIDVSLLVRFCAGFPRLRDSLPFFQRTNPQL